MYTECPICKTIYRFYPRVIEESKGIILCVRCNYVYDGISTLRSHPFHGDATVGGLERQIVERGDQVFVTHRASPAQPWRPPEASWSEQFQPDSVEQPAQLTASLEGTSGKADHDARWVGVSTLHGGHVGLAFRNLLRNRRRTGIALCGIGFGVIAVLLAGGFIEWIFWAMRESTIHSRLGHIQVVQEGYFHEGASDPFAYLLPERAPELAAMERMEHVQVVSPRLAFSGLISHEETTVSFIGEGVDPEKEARVSLEVHIRDGEGLSAKEPNGIILGTGLAANLGVRPGDSVVLLSSTSTGGINAVEARVRGIFFTSTKAFDDSALRLNIDVVRTLLRARGAHTWVVLIDETKMTDKVVNQLDSTLPDSAGRLEIVPWYELATFYNKTVKLFKRQIDVVAVVIGLIILLSISNTLVMSVLERTGEIGTLMAIGLKRNRILRLFVDEGFYLGIIGGLAGLAIGYVLAEVISSVGIPMPPPPGMDVGFTGEILVTWPLAAGALTTAVGATVLASIYPAWKASRLEIVDALRHNL